MKINLDSTCSISEDSLKRFCSACPSLEEVKLGGFWFSDTIVEVLLHHLPALRSLELYLNNDVTGRCFSLLPDSLQRLSVTGCTGLQSDSLRQVAARCPRLRELNVSDLYELQAGDLMEVSDLYELQAGDLMAVLTGCTQLERLTHSLPVPLEQCLPPAGLPALRHLDVSRGVLVTDTTLRQLPRLLPGLHTLNIQSTSDRAHHTV